MTIEQKITMINSWLRHHQDHKVRLDFCGIYGCIEVDISRDGATKLFFTFGDTLEHRLDEIIGYLKIGYPYNEQAVRTSFTRIGSDFLNIGAGNGEGGMQ